ncbi:hypothetical protein DL93DRAFT_2224719 [Clavulina sp. PMI_390]|nr:hypothetical protein DL93DRAFT_2224719 [Clavulina sp. PMI_390]
MNLPFLPDLNVESLRRVSSPRHSTIYYRGGDEVIGSATPGPIRELLETKAKRTLGELGKSIVELQLSLHTESVKEAEAQQTSSVQASLVEHASTKIFDGLTGSEDDISAILAIPAQLARELAWNSARMPYSVFCGLKKQLLRGNDAAQGVFAQDLLDFPNRDIDEWILANERVLRDDRRNDWKIGLVDYALHADLVFRPSPKSTASARVIQRETLSGYTILDELRAPNISMQASFASFQAMFTKITNSLLNGLDWSNIFVAGGIVLSTLLCTTERDLEKSVQSDIDIYIYGLDPIAANKKVQHIFEVWKSNLPESSRDKTLVVRNSRTITFFSDYPIKRIQIVLKLVENPKAVLLNFDLDICAMGYDGATLIMLPRAARALETGYNVFTMDLVQGHYLGERRASQESRVFKYADKPSTPRQGWGLRFLPSYINSLVDSFACGPASDYHRGREHGSATHPPDLHHIAVRAGFWTQLAIKKRREQYYNMTSQSFHAASPIEFTYADLEPEQRPVVKSEPGERSCLTSYELLMRHVELWREKVRGGIKMTRMVWASDNYDVSATGYDDSPKYRWEKDFEFEAFRRALDTYNLKDYRAFCTQLEEVGHTNRKSHPSGLGNTKTEGVPPFHPLIHDQYTVHSIYVCNHSWLWVAHGRTRRITVASDVSTVLEPQGDMILLFFASPGFAAFANGLVEDALEDHGLVFSREGKMIEVLGEFTSYTKKVKVEMLKWTIDSVVGWQQIDRRIDEVFEILWAFYRSFGEASLSGKDLRHKFFTEVGRRTIRPTPTDEYAAFGRWVLKGVARLGDEEDLQSDEEDEQTWFE